jgi:hypothetical protein
MDLDERWLSSWLRDKLMNSRMPSRSSTGYQVCRRGWWVTEATPAMPFVSPSGSAVRVRRSPPSATRHPSPARLDLQQPQPSRAALGQAQGVASRCHPLREDCLKLHGRPRPRSRMRLAQVITGRSVTCEPCRVYRDSAVRSLIRRRTQTLVVPPVLCQMDKKGSHILHSIPRACAGAG